MLLCLAYVACSGVVLIRFCLDFGFGLVVCWPICGVYCCACLVCMLLLGCDCLLLDLRLGFGLWCDC